MDYPIKFDSMAALVDAAKRGPGGTSREDSRPQYFGCSFEKAVEYATHGWPEGAAKAKALLDKLNVASLRESFNDTVLDVQGSYVDVGEYLQGTPECMVDFKPDTRAARFAHIIVTSSYSVECTPPQVLMRGAVIAAVVDILESRGVRCSIDLVSRIKSYSDTLTIIAPAKRAHDPLNLDVLTFATAHLAYNRRLQFAVREGHPKAVQFGCYADGHYGISQTAPSSPGAILFPVMNENDPWDEAFALKIIHEILDTYVKEGV